MFMMMMMMPMPMIHNENKKTSRRKPFATTSTSTATSTSTSTTTRRICRLSLILLVALLLLVSEPIRSVHAFQISTQHKQRLHFATTRGNFLQQHPHPHQKQNHHHHQQQHRQLPQSIHTGSLSRKNDRLFLAPTYNNLDDNDDNGDEQELPPQEQEQQQPTLSRRQRIVQKLRHNRIVKSIKRLKCRLSTNIRKRAVAAILIGSVSGGIASAAISPIQNTAHASAPVMAVPKQEQRDPITDAMLNHERKMVQKQQEEMAAMTQKAREIEQTKGPAARAKFEKEYKEKKEKEAKEKLEGLKELKRDLLEQGIDPTLDIEGQRQVVLYEKGLDLGKVPGTRMYMEKQFESASPNSRTYKKSSAYKKEHNRRVLKAMVKDMKNKDIDPLQFVEEREDKVKEILQMPAMAAAQLADMYEANLEQYGQIDTPKEGEMSVKEKMAKAGGSTAGTSKAAAKEEQKRAKAEAKAKAAAEKKKAKEEAKAAKEAAKKEKEAAKAAKKAAAAAGAAATSAGAAVAGTTSDVTDAVKDTAADVVGQGQKEESSSSDETGADSAEIEEGEEDIDSSAIQTETDVTTTESSKRVRIGGKKVPVIPLAGGTVVAVAGSGYAIKIMRDKAAVDEEERERQLRRLMQGFNEDEDDDVDDNSSPGQASALEVMDFEDDRKSKSKEDVSPTPSPPPAPKKKRLGFFAKKSKNDRETDLNLLVSSEATAPEFATLLAKILAYGAPGRFPSVDALPGQMPFETFDLETAKQQLIDAREDAGISLEESAEVFAGVVNCLLIDIVDLASATLKEKNETLTVNGISVVVDFMNHAASLYESVAGDVVIKPVTYGGDLGRGKLEQMYSAYATSGMTGMFSGDVPADFDDRVQLLQDVFQINPKKAEGLMMKAMQKNMMKMMKEGGGAGFEDMMKNMGDGMGLDGTGLDGEGAMDFEELKGAMLALKEMKDSGALDEKEMKTMRNQFKDAFGKSIDDIMKEAEADKDGLPTEDKEILDLMKEIMRD